MKPCFFFLIALIALSSCDDGDIIVTNFDFDSNSALQLCKTNASNVLYIVNDDPAESISFNFSDPDFDGTYPEDVESKTITVNLSSSYHLVYRAYDGSLNGDNYFCSGVPPTQPSVTNEYTSKDGGYIELIIVMIDQSMDEQTNILTRKFETYAIAHNITLVNTSNGEEIVKETMRLGSFKKTKEFDLSTNPTPLPAV